MRALKIIEHVSLDGVVRHSVDDNDFPYSEWTPPYLVLSGSSTLTSTLLESELADQVMLIIYPVLLGTGTRLFAEGTPARSLDVVDSTTTSSGVILVTYRSRAAEARLAQRRDVPVRFRRKPTRQVS